MIERMQLIEALDARVERREGRRAFFKAALGAAAVGTGAFAFASAAQAQAAPSDADVLNFALNLEYLEANFYSYAVFGTPIVATSTTGTGNPGLATGGRAVAFTDPVVAQYAREIANDEIAHVNFLRNALGQSAVAQPTIDVGISPTGAFSSAAQAAGVVPAGGVFDPYASDENFLLGAFIFEDVGVTAYKGASPLITNPTYLEAAAGLLAVEAYHASIVRTVITRKGIDTPTLVANTARISDARDALDGSPAEDLVRGIGPDDDQGVGTVNLSTGVASNIAPLNANGLAFSRTTGQVLNIVYLNKNAVTMGGFFPNGVNGSIKTSTAN